MNTKTKNMTGGTPLKLILLVALPLFIGNIFQEIYTVVDTVIVGYSLGDPAIAAIGATGSIYSFILDIAWGLNGGYMIIVSRLFGAGDKEKLKKSIATILVLNIAVTAVLTVAALFGLRTFMHLMKVPESIFEQAYGYIFIILAGMLFSMCYNMCASLMRAFGNSRTPLIFLIISSVINLSFDVLFVVVFRFGVMGAAAATVIAQMCSAVLASIYVLRNYKEYLPKREHFKLQRKLVCKLTATGLSMAAMYCVVDIGSIFYQCAVNGLGELYITAQTSSRKLIEMGMMPFESLSSANATFIGQNFGAGKFDRIRKCMRSVAMIDVIYGVAMFILFFFFGGTFVRLLTNTSDAAVIANATMSINCHFACYPALGILLVFRTTMQSLGYKAIPVSSSMIELAVKIVAALFLIPVFGYLCVCLTEPFIWVVCAAFILLSFFIIKPVKKAEIQYHNRKEVITDD